VSKNISTSYFNRTLRKIKEGRKEGRKEGTEERREGGGRVGGRKEDFSCLHSFLSKPSDRN
jgi:hypothetical protein